MKRIFILTLIIFVSLLSRISGKPALNGKQVNVEVSSLCSGQLFLFAVNVKLFAFDWLDRFFRYQIN